MSELQLVMCLVAVFLLPPVWAVAMSIHGLLDAKRDKVICETLEYVARGQVKYSSLPTSLAKRLK